MRKSTLLGRLFELFIDFFPVFLVLGLVASIAGLFAGQYFSQRASCENYAALTGEPHVFQFNGGCRIKRDGRWISLEAAEGGARDLTIREAR